MDVSLLRACVRGRTCPWGCGWRPSISRGATTNDLTPNGWYCYKTPLGAQWCGVVCVRVSVCASGVIQATSSFWRDRTVESPHTFSLFSPLLSRLLLSLSISPFHLALDLTHFLSLPYSCVSMCVCFNRRDRDHGHGHDAPKLRCSRVDAPTNTSCCTGKNQSRCTKNTNGSVAIKAIPALHTRLLPSCTCFNCANIIGVAPLPTWLAGTALLSRTILNVCLWLCLGVSCAPRDSCAICVCARLVYS